MHLTDAQYKHLFFTVYIFYIGLPCITCQKHTFLIVCLDLQCVFAVRNY